MARRFRVIVRKNGRECGEMSYSSESEARVAAGRMGREGAAGVEALMLGPARTENRRRRNPPKALTGSTRPTRTSQVDAYLATHGFPGVRLHRSARDAYCHFYGGEADRWDETSVYVPRVSDLTLDGWLEEARMCAGQRRNPSIGRGTAHRDRVAAAVAQRLRREGESKAEATSRAYAIATAAEQRRQGLRKNPMTADLASMPFEEFCKHVVVGKGYNTLSNRRFVRVHSRDKAVMTDVPVSDGDGSPPLKRAIDVKRRAYDQLRIHLIPQPSVAEIEQANRRRRQRRRNPDGGRVSYGGHTIHIVSGTYRVEGGPSFSGPGGFVAAKKWIDQHGG